MSMGIRFTQYMRPNGRPEDIYIGRSKEIEDKAREIREAGFEFECEVLMSGEVSLTIAGKNSDAAIEVVFNGPQVPEAVDRMIRNFDIADALKKQEEDS